MISLRYRPFVFPVSLLLLFVLLVTFALHGSSIGIYHSIFYGNTSDDSLLLNSPQSIRSDEWLVGTQKTISQVNGGLKETNLDIGNGENEAFISDAPSIGVASIFKPHNFGFFLLPTDNAYAFKWWLPLALLALSTYLLSLTILPKKYLLSSIVATLFTLSPFFMWWYSFGVIAVVFFALFGTLALFKLFESKNVKSEFLWSLLLIYSGIGFTLVLYPPFQIPIAIVLVLFCLAYLVSKSYPRKIFKRKLLLTAYSIGAALLSIVLILLHYGSVVSALSNSSYPGQRTIESGGYHISSLLSGYSQIFLQYSDRGIVNPSESSNFLLLMPILLPILIYLAIKKYKKLKKIDFVTLSLTVASLLFLSWVFIPGIDFLGVISLLNKVPHSRLLIGFGLINVLSILWFIKVYSDDESVLSARERLVVILAACLFFVASIFMVNFDNPPQFILPGEVFVLTAVMASVVFLLICKRFLLAVCLLLLFTVVSIWQIHPLYKGVSVLTDNSLSVAIREISANSDKRWASDDIYIENFPAMNGARGVSGTYLYPQTSLWRDTLPDEDYTVYNRYAHINFSFDRIPGDNIATDTNLVAQDQFVIRTEPCSRELSKLDVGYIITTTPISQLSGPCLNEVEVIPFKTRTYHIYSIDK